MFLGFDFHRDDSIKDLDEKLARINKFLADKRSFDPYHQHFGIFLLPPSKSTPVTCSFTNNLAKRQSKSKYRLCIEFFRDGIEYLPELELIYDLGKTSHLYDAMQKEVKSVSFLCAYPSNAEVTFIKSEHSISILFNFSDDDPVITTIQKHLELLLKDN